MESNRSGHGMSLPLDFNFPMTSVALGTTRALHHGAVDVGTPTCDRQDWVKTTVYFHDFARQLFELEVDNKCTSPIFSCLGYEWAVSICWASADK